MDDLVLEEAKVLSRNYSAFRADAKKWKIFSRQEWATQQIQVRNEKDETIILISRGRVTVDGYRSKDLYKRAMIKRNTAYFKSVLGLWDIINPFHISGISEKVYKAVYTEIYIRIAKDAYSSEYIESYIESDRKVDFVGRKCLGFADFFDGLFELVDCNTRSMLACEYCHFVNQLALVAEEAIWNSGVNLYSKTHIDLNKRPMFAPWMIEVFNRDRVGKGIVPKMLRTPPDVKVSERLLAGRKLKPVDKENFTIKKLEKVHSERGMKLIKLENFKGSKMARIRKVKSQDRKAKTFYTSYIEKISPLSSMIKTSRSKNNILECVIDGRKALLKKDATDSLEA